MKKVLIMASLLIMVLCVPFVVNTNTQAAHKHKYKTIYQNNGCGQHTVTKECTVKGCKYKKALKAQKHTLKKLNKTYNNASKKYVTTKKCTKCGAYVYTYSKK